MLSVGTASLPGRLGRALRPLTPGAEENGQARCGGSRLHAWRAARNAGGTSLKPPPAPRSSLPEYKRIPAPLQKTATINVTHQPVPGLPLNHTQRQKWLDFEFYLKVNPTALYFSRKSSPYQTLPHTHPQKNPNRQTAVLCISSYAQDSY